MHDYRDGGDPAITDSGLHREINRQRPIDSPEEEALLNVMRTAGVLEGGLHALFKTRGLSSSTYNVLRILRGAGPAGKRCSDIGCDMVVRVPDVTRLLDRLEGRGLVARERSSEDRRTVVARITPAGLELLAGLDEPLRALHRAQLGHMGRQELADLSRLAARARASAPEGGVGARG